MMDIPNYQIILLIAIGIVAGTLNIIAGGGSFMTLPTLIFVGVPPLIANASNRVAIMMQNIVGIRQYRSLGVRPKVNLQAIFFLVMPGAAIGAWSSTQFSNSSFKLILAVIMLVMSFVTLLKSDKKKETGLPKNQTLINLGYFFIGLYGGFIQAGVGFLVLMLMSIEGHDIVQSNAIKLIMIAGVTAVSLFVFITNHQVNWMAGVFLGIGNIGGAFIGTRIVVKSKHATLEKLVQIAIIIMAILLIVRS